MVSLRPILPPDRYRIMEILTSPKVNKTYMLPDFPQWADAFPVFIRLSKLSQEKDKYVRAIMTEDGPVGFLNHTEIEGRKIELGFAIHPDFQGKGIMSAALPLAIDELFSLGYEEVTAGAFSTNAASIRVMEKSGMIPLDKYGEIEYRGSIHSCVYYSRKKPELTFQCCFCGKATTPRNSYTLTITHAHDPEGPEQALYCCRSCLEQRLADPMMLYLKYL